MSEQPYTLFDLEPTRKLTDRQQAVLQALQAAAHDGLTADEAGAIAHGLKETRWAHGPNDRCQFCGQDGKAILERLAQLGLATYRRANRARGTDGAWIATRADDPAADTATEPAGDWNQDGPIPYGHFPEGF